MEIYEKCENSLHIFGTSLCTKNANFYMILAMSSIISFNLYGALKRSPDVHPDTKSNLYPQAPSFVV